MRPIYWGLALTFVGICSYIIFVLVAFRFFVKSLDGIKIVSMPPAVYFAIFAILFSFPLAIAIEAYRYLKGRKGEV